MVCLVRPDGEGLWPLVWANVPHGEPLNPSELETLPWMRPTKVSRRIGGQVVESLPDSDSPTRPDPEVFFSQPRRIRLVEHNGCVTHFIQERYGASYPPSLWFHPLTPYDAKGTQLFPRRPKPGSFGYRHWRGVLLQERQRPTAVGSCTVPPRYRECRLHPDRRRLGNEQGHAM